MTFLEYGMGLLDFVKDDQSKEDMLKNFLTMLQAANNTAASSISGPVDLIAAGLGKAGMNIPMPMGGSKWMENAGFVQPVQPGAPQIAGETIGLLAAPMMGMKYVKGKK
jgi:hypothetical protein